MELVREKKPRKKTRHKEIVTEAPEKDKVTSHNDECSEKEIVISEEETGSKIVQDSEPVEQCNTVHNIETPTTETKSVSIENLSETIPKAKALEHVELLMKNQSILKEIVNTTEESEQKEETIVHVQQEPSAPEITELDFYQIHCLNREILNSIADLETVENPMEITKVHPLTEIEANNYYFNHKLQKVVEFDKGYTQYLQNNYWGLKTHSLFEYIKKYYTILQKIHGLNLDIQQLEKSINVGRQKIWTEMTESQEFHGKCIDDNKISHKVFYATAVFNEQWNENLKQSLKNLLNLSTNMIRISRVISKMWNRIIDMEIDTIRQNCLDGEINIINLRLILRVLFHFMHKISPHENFTIKLKNWFLKIMEVFNRNVCFENTIFMVSHILRCPSNYAIWAADHVEIRAISNPIGSEEIDECLAVLWMLLRPINKWVDKTKSKQNVEIAVEWLVVDSDGEDYSDSDDLILPNETVLLALLDRIPFGKLFSVILGVDLATVNLKISCQNLLQFIIFSTTLVNILNEGLRNYSQEKYKNFTKRLAAMMKHSSDFVSSLYRVFTKNDVVRDPLIWGRLSTEYDIFIIRLCQHVIENKLVWQYLNQMDFNRLQTNSYWKLYFYLLTKFPEDVSCDFHDNFKLKYKTEFSFTNSLCGISDLPTMNLYFLLETMLNLALGCDKQDFSFTETVTEDLFQIAFILKSTKETCYKIARDLICTITKKYPHLIMNILNTINRHLNEVDDQAIYLLKAIPFVEWKPPLQVLDFIRSFLLFHKIGTVQHNIGKLVVSYLNWNFDANGELFLSYDFHFRAALIVFESALKHCPKREQYENIFLDNPHADPTKNYISWCWKIILRLRLHSVDQSLIGNLYKLNNTCANVIYNASPDNIPNMTNVLIENNVFAIALGLFLCDFGNDIELIEDKGLPYLRNLVDKVPTLIIIRCLELIVPLFIDSSERVAQNETLQMIITKLCTVQSRLFGLLNSNEGIELMSKMVTKQLIEFNKYGPEHSVAILNLWLMILTNPKNWYQTDRCLVINSVMEFSFTIPSSWGVCKDFFYQHYVTKRNSMLPKNMSGNTVLNFLLCEIEFDIHEKQTNLWNTVLMESNKNSIDVTKALKKLSSNHPPGGLMIFKWAELFMETNNNHELLPLIIQQFLILYLSQVIAKKWILAANSSLINNVTKKLNTIITTFEGHHSSNTDERHLRSQELLIKFYKNCVTWIKEDLTGMESLEDTNPYLKTILSNKSDYWINLVQMSSIRNRVKLLSDDWKGAVYRKESEPKVRKSISTDRNDFDILESIIKTISFYKTKNPNQIILSKAPPIDERKLMKWELKNLEKLFNQEITHDYNDMQKYMDSVIQDYFNLYKTREKVFVEKKRCSRLSSQCTGMGKITIRYEYKTLATHVQDSIEDKLMKIFNLAQNNIAAQDEHFINIFFQINYTIIVCGKRCSNNDHKLCIICIEQFFKLYDIFSNSVISKFSMLKEYFEDIQDQMRLIFTKHQEMQCNNLLRKCLELGQYTDCSLGIINPQQMNAKAFLSAYRLIINQLDLNNGTEVVKCLLKFDIFLWLKLNNTTQSLIVEICEIVFKGLMKSRQNINDDSIFKTLSIHLLQLFVFKFNESFEIIFKEIISNPIITEPTLENVIRTMFEMVKIEMGSLDCSNQIQMRANFKTLAKSQVIEKSYWLWIVDFLEKFYSNPSNQQKLYGFLKNRDVLICFYELIFVSLQENYDNALTEPARLSTCFDLLTKLYNNWICFHSSNIDFAEITTKFEMSFFYHFNEINKSDKCGHLILNWYLKNYALNQRCQFKLHKCVVYKNMIQIEWNTFKPTLDEIEWIYRTTMQPINTTYPFIFHLVRSIDWKDVLAKLQIPMSTNFNLLSKLLFIFVKLSFEDSNRNDECFSAFMESIYELPWAIVDEAGFCDVLHYVVLANSFTNVLNLGTESPNNDKSILKLLQISAQLINAQGQNLPPLKVKSGFAKQLKLVTSMTKLFQLTETNAHSLSENQIVYYKKSAGRFMTVLKNHFLNEPIQPFQVDEFQLIVWEILQLMIAPKPYNLTYQALISWCQENNNNTDKQLFRSIMLSLNNATTLHKQLVLLLEFFIEESFKNSADPSWNFIIENIRYVRLIPTKDQIISESFLLVMHAAIVYNLKVMDDNFSRFSFIENLVLRLSFLKEFSNSDVEYKVVLLWSLAICTSFKIYQINSNPAILTRIISNLIRETSKPDGWGNSLLSAIGLNKVPRRELVFKYLACVLIKQARLYNDSDYDAYLQQFIKDSKTNRFGDYRNRICNLVDSYLTKDTDSANFNANLEQALKVFYDNSSHVFENVATLWTFD